MLRSTTYINAEDLLPKTWIRNGIWGTLSSDAPFSWGDNDITLVTASRFADHIEDALQDEVDKSTLTKVLKKIKAQGEVYVNLEA
jgi:hypothetical protein